MAVSLLRAPGMNAAGGSRRPRLLSQASMPVANCFSRPHTVAAAYSRTKSWEGAPADALESLIEDMAKQLEQVLKQWQAQSGGLSSSFFWPGIHAYGSSHYGTHGPDEQRSMESSKPNGTPSLPIDVVSAGNFYLLYADVPGLAKSDLSIKLSGPNKEPRVLKISGQRTAPYQQQQQQNEEQGDRTVNSSTTNVVQQQRVFGSFGSSWELPADADSEGISAKVSEGVLTVTVPKKKKQESDDDSREIAIE